MGVELWAVAEACYSLVKQSWYHCYSPREAGRFCSRLEARLSSRRLLRSPISEGTESRRFSERSRR